MPRKRVKLPATPPAPAGCQDCGGEPYAVVRIAALVEGPARWRRACRPCAERLDGLRLLAVGGAIRLPAVSSTAGG